MERQPITHLSILCHCCLYVYSIGGLHSCIHANGYISGDRNPVPSIERKKKLRREALSSPSILDSAASSSHNMSEFGRSLPPEAGSERSSYTQRSAPSRKSLADEEDALLRTIKAQHSLSRQMTDETSEASALLSPNMGKVGEASALHDQSASETEL